MLAQSAGDPSTLAGPLREIVRGLDGNLPIYGVRTMEALYQMRAVSIFRVLITVIGAHGTDGTRPRDRRPLRSGRVCGRHDGPGRSAFGWPSARTAPQWCEWCCGRASCSRSRGWPLEWWRASGAGQLLQAAFPTGDDQSDIVALLLVVPIVLAVTFLAAYVPARHASRVDPILALRHE